LLFPARTLTLFFTHTSIQNFRREKAALKEKETPEEKIERRLAKKAAKVTHRSLHKLTSLTSQAHPTRFTSSPHSLHKLTSLASHAHLTRFTSSLHSLHKLTTTDTLFHPFNYLPRLSFATTH
jgi:hypothetical protein